MKKCALLLSITMVSHTSMATQFGGEAEWRKWFRECAASAGTDAAQAMEALKTCEKECIKAGKGKYSGYDLQKWQFRCSGFSGDVSHEIGKAQTARIVANHAEWRKWFRECARSSDMEICKKGVTLAV